MTENQYSVLNNYKTVYNNYLMSFEIEARTFHWLLELKIIDSSEAQKINKNTYSMASETVP